MPCSTCVQYRCDCTSTDSSLKKRAPPKGYIESLELRLRDMEKLLQQRLQENNNNNNNEAQMDKAILDNGSDTDDNADQDSSSSPKDLHSTKVIRHIGVSSPYYLMGKQKQEEEESNNLGQSQTLYPDLVGNNSKHEQSHLTVSLKQGKLHLVYDDDTNDLMVIHDCSPLQKGLKQSTRADGGGVFDDIMSGPLIKTLMQKFIKLRPAIIPMIGERSISEALQNQHANRLLISSICSYVTMFLPEDDQTFDKYAIDRKDLIQKLAIKENELLRTAFLDPTISNIQAIIILCCHPTQGSIYSGIWLRAGIAIRMSQDLGLYRSFTNASNSRKVRELGNLLWHCVYILDRWSCAVLGRPLAIVDSDCNVDLPEPSTESTSDEVDDKDDKEDYTYFTAFIKLTGILGEIQQRIYSPKAKASLSGASTTATVNSLQRLLLEWYDQLPAEARSIKDDMTRLSSPSMTKEEKDVLLQSKQWQLVAPLMITYHAVTILLHRPFIISDNELLFSPAGAKRCLDSAIMATDIARLLDISSFTHFCWNIVMYSLSVVVSIHLFNCSSDQLDVRETAHDYLRHVMELWNTLESKFPCAPKLISGSHLQFALSFLGLKEVVRPSTELSSSGSNESNQITQSPTASFYDKSPESHDHRLQQQQQQPFPSQPIHSSHPMTYSLPESIPTSSSNSLPAMGNQLPDQDSWQRFFLNNTGPSSFGFSDGNNGDGFWQSLPLF
ncbi:fungal-specific transcription factor domain-containing protein [Chlamydoabsidia padenii]|nr:fungal-specific transcription factor domain-containing protein [Chlamydoabsidia padenii]